MSDAAAGADKAQAAVDTLAKYAPDAVRLAKARAYYAPEDFPAIWSAAVRPVPQMNKALGFLASHNVITLIAEAVGIHRLTQAVLLPPTKRMSRPGGTRRPGSSPSSTSVTGWSSSSSRLHRGVWH
jgi:hypothetical protein